MPRLISLPPPAEPDCWVTPDFAAPVPYEDGEFVPDYADLARLCSRIAAKVVVTEYGCWEWTGAYVLAHRNRRTRYGRVWWRGRAELVHRVVWTLFYGAIPAEKESHHWCNNTLCCRPCHLEPLDPGCHAWIHREAESYAAD